MLSPNHLQRLLVTKRDIALLLMVYSFDGCAISHLARRFWNLGSKQFGPRSAFYRRIGLLIDVGYLQAERLPSLIGTGGSGKSFITLGKNGRQLVAEYLGLSRSDLRRLRHIETPFAAAHHLAVCDFRLVLQLACENSGVELAEWKSERGLRIPPIVKVRDPRPPKDSPTPPMIPLIADGEFVLRLADGTSQGFKLEMDLGTVAKKRLSQRLRGQMVHAKQDDKPVLWVVPDEGRAQAIATWAQDEARQLVTDPTVLWVTTRDCIQAETVLLPIWQVIGGPRMALVPELSPSLVPSALTASTPQPVLRREEKPWRG